MSFYRLQLETPVDTAQGADTIVNTLHFASDDAGAQVLEMADILADQIIPIWNAFDVHLSENCANTVTWTFYDMEDPPPRVPLATSSFAIVVGATQLPNQTAIQVGFRAALASGQPRARRRGRIFLGPLAATASEDTTGDTRVPSTVRNLIGSSFGGMIPSFTGTSSGSSIVPCIFSVSTALGLAVGQAPPTPEPTFTSAQLGAGFLPIIEVRIPDRHSTVRSRRTGVSVWDSFT